MKVSIVTEGFQNTGYGHITRCLSLYQAFEERKITPTLFINGDKNAEGIVGNSNFQIIDWLNHPTQLVTEINHGDILIIDSYTAGIEFYERFSKFSKFSLFIDDTLRINYPSGIILNGTINAESFPYKKNSVHDFLLGTKFTPLRNNFWKCGSKKINPNIQSILITFGGQDNSGLTLPILKLLNEIYPHVIKKVVIGSGYSNSQDIDKSRNDYTEIILNPDAAKMCDLMLSSDVAISAAGQTLYELASTGTPTIAICVAENQKYNINEWKRKKFIIDPIFNTDVNFLRKVVEQIKSFESISVRKKVSRIGRESVDGVGALRTVNYIIDKFCSTNYFYLRKAVLQDSQIVFELSNELDVRTQSISRKSINRDEHEIWFNKKISEEDYLFLLAFDNKDNFIGQLRFQIINRQAVVSISLIKNFRGKGLSKKILKDGCSRIFSTKNITEIIAYIKPENIASIHSFESTGFIQKSNEVINEETYLKFILNRK